MDDILIRRRVSEKFRALLNEVIAFEADQPYEALPVWLEASRELTKQLERIDKVIKSMPEAPRGEKISRVLRTMSGSSPEAKAILDLETSARVQMLS